MKTLVVIDMQNDFIDGVLGTKEAKEVVPKVVQKIDTFVKEAEKDDEERCVIATVDIHYDGYLDTQEGRNLPVEHCMDQTEGSYINDDVKDALVLSSDRVKFLMHDKSSFASLDAVEEIVNLRIVNLRRDGMDALEDDEVIFIGVCTDICVISNAMLLKAVDPELRITVDAACCAGTTPENHENALRAMRQCQINIENWKG